ncbi:cytochrome P450 [Halteromyces radiatus]|uniref:cytochrome P450 n=1 Tax=Halteromyces radiatus TaxID=101107 RepID=UPI00222109BA|nr:cytochrome P450 [Halteromyces radiatus]KAI8098834.1 cytochrome P450 [Halteromyces radiatus]
MYSSKSSSSSSSVPVVPHALPLVGHAFALSKNPRNFILKAKQQCGPIFRIQLPMLSGYVVTGDYVNEILRASRHQFSFQEGIDTIIPLGRVTRLSYDHKYKGEPYSLRDRNPVSYPIKYHLGANNLHHFSTRIQEASHEAFEQELVLGPGETRLITVWPMMTRIIARISCFCFAGRQVAHIPKFVDSMAQFTQKIIIAGTFLSLLPTWLGNYVVRRFLSLEKEIDLFMTHLTPQLEHLEDNGYDDEKDMTYGAWLLTLPRRDGSIRPAQEIAYRFKDVVLASVHTTSHFLTFALHELACRPTLVEHLRQEIKTLPADQQLNPSVINDLPLLDSFFREVLRYNVDYLGLHHKALQDVLLSNGAVIPKGALVFCAMDDANTFPNNSNDPSLTSFDAYRYLDSDQPSTTTTMPGFVTFGFGPHACPGRFFAVMEVKYSIAKFVSRYNMTTLSGQRGKDVVIMGMTRNPPKDPILFEGI